MACSNIIRGKSGTEKEMRILAQCWERLNLKKENMKKDMASSEVATRCQTGIFTHKRSPFAVSVSQSPRLILWPLILSQLYKLLYIPLCSTSFHLSQLLDLEVLPQEDKHNTRNQENSRGDRQIPLGISVRINDRRPHRAPNRI
jgi:hypothetical protein